MIHDLLLAYLSEKGRGTWKELREAWDWLVPDQDPAGKAWIVAQDLSALGHLEVDWNPEGMVWCAAPPVITMIPRSGGRALVTGARTRALFDPGRSKVRGEDSAAGDLVDAVDDLQLWLDEFSQARGPTTLMIACRSHLDAQKLAERVGLRYTFSVAQQLAGLLPGIDQYAKLWPAGELPRGFDFERYDTSLLRWIPVDNADSQGLYRARTYSEYVHALNGPLSWRHVSREHGVYEVLRWAKRDLLVYDARTHELAVPFHAPLPGLHARAAVLSSGRLPVARDRPISKPGKGGIYSRIYSNVDDEVAQRIALALGQTLAIR